ncbi:hypothetical protein ACFO0O_03840 [Cobetia amphilecti]|uniref:Uncharacterized protein n=1 Tax=Cobetia amphilecti TaxID=1055104 RepID=A0ABT6UTZ7_9GAMM|nr:MULTISPECIES: hypothetical protein [Cobetia]MDI5886181.1 hypothetical protein [Cobetia amphilecti]NVN56954.1 hypothetical protein [bacterium Scap17]
MPVTLEGIALPADIQWTDEMVSHGVGQVQTPTLTGALVVEESAQAAGRSITLASGGGAWVTRSTVLALSELAATPRPADTPMVLVWGDGRTFDCVFDHAGGEAVSASEVLRLAAGSQDADHPYTITLRLITV